MKLISEHLGEIIVALAGVALLISAITFFSADISGFFSGIISKLVELGNGLVDNMTVNVPSVN